MRTLPLSLALVACGGAAEPPADADAVELRVAGGCDVIVPRDAATVQAGIDLAADGDTVCVGAGTWVENLDLSGRTLTLTGLGSRRTFLDGGGAGPVVTVVDATVTLTDVAIQHGLADAGGGLAIEQAVGSTSVTLERVVVRDNEADVGGGLWAYHADVTATDVSFLRNAAVSGGAVSVSEVGFVGDRLAFAWNTAEVSGGAVSAGRALFVLTNSDLRANEAGSYGGALSLFTVSGPIASTVIAGNVAGDEGGGAALDGYSTTSFENVVISRNRAASGGAVVVSYVNGADFRNAAITSNLADDGLGGVVVADPGGWASFAYSDLWSNGADVSGVPDPVGADGNVAVAPLYEDLTGARPLAWDFHLRADSPLVDAGDPALTDPDGTPSDIGAYGGATFEP